MSEQVKQDELEGYETIDSDIYNACTLCALFGELVEEVHEGCDKVNCNKQKRADGREVYFKEV